MKTPFVFLCSTVFFGIVYSVEYLSLDIATWLAYVPIVLCVTDMDYNRPGTSVGR